MLRFERKIQGKPFFLEIDQEDNRIIKRHNLTAHQYSYSQFYITEIEAKAAYHKILYHKLYYWQKVSLPIIQPSYFIPLPRIPELEQALQNNIEDQEAWLVYGDWLHMQNDIRGELIDLQAMYQHLPLERKKLAKQRIYQLKKYIPAFFSPQSFYHLLYKGLNLSFIWRYGFIHSLRWRWDKLSFPFEYIQTLAKSPPTLFLHSIIWQAEVPFTWDMAKTQWPTLPLNMLCKAFPTLKKLELQGSEYLVESLTDCFALKTLILSIYQSELLISSQLPQLKKLVVPLDPQREYCYEYFDISAILSSIFEAKRYPQLKHLEISLDIHHHALLTTLLAHSKLTKQLETITINTLIRNDLLIGLGKIAHRFNKCIKIQFITNITDMLHEVSSRWMVFDWNNPILNKKSLESIYNILYKDKML